MGKIKIDLSMPLLDLSGKQKGTLSLGRLLAEYLMAITSADYKMLFMVSISLLNDEPFEITVEEHKRISEIVDRGNMENIMKHRILENLKDGN